MHGYTHRCYECTCMHKFIQFNIVWSVFPVTYYFSLTFTNGAMVLSILIVN